MLCSNPQKRSKELTKRPTDTSSTPDSILDWLGYINACWKGWSGWLKPSWTVHRQNRIVSVREFGQTLSKEVFANLLPKIMQLT